MLDAGGMQLCAGRSSSTSSSPTICSATCFRHRRDVDRLARHAALGLLGEVDARRSARALYEPVHGSAPISPAGVANPIAMLAAFGMALRYSFNMGKEADLLDAAIAAALARGLRTADLKSEGTTVVGTAEMGEAIVGEMERLAAA
jgi:isocitrate/isopropylmalate dehydrogenase